MGFLQRLMSLGSKKHKNKGPKNPHNIVMHSAVDLNSFALDEDHEAAANRLLRSSSMRYAVVKELDCSTLPPLPHPINNFIETPPTSSAMSIASSTISRQGTYSVKVHQRQQHTESQFPTAYPEVFETPKRRRHLSENNDLLRLRSDPSVVSLVDMYDAHGQLPLKVFSNSPPTHESLAPSIMTGRAQTKRSGSTLRQLLGGGSSYQDGGSSSSLGEGDISWADRYLREADARSSVSSLPLETPKDSFDDFTCEPTIRDPDQSYDVSMISEHPSISSLEVEVSLDTAAISFEVETTPTPLQPKTPRRASQIFGFLTEKRKSVVETGRDLPDLPSFFSSPSDVASHEDDNLRSHFSDTSCGGCDTAIAETPGRHRPEATSGDFFGQPLNQPNPHTPATPKRSQTHEYPQEHTPNRDSHAPQVRVIMTAPTRVIVTAPTPTTGDKIPHTGRSLRGPRAHVKRKPTLEKRPTLLDRSNSNSHGPKLQDLFTPIPSKRTKTRRSASTSTTNSINSTRESRTAAKENSVGLSAKVDVPSTPLRSISHPRTLHRTSVDPSFFQPPSPNTSAELSPVTRRIMMDLREQKRRAPDERRRRSRRAA